jgi:DNA-binding transcriptional LysR family regulator
MHISWSDAQTFLAIAEGGSISGGAARLGLGQPTVSRRIAQLENRLGCALFTRSKQGVALTEAGARLVPAAEQMARWASEFARLARGAEAHAEGVVRIAAPPGIAVDLLAPLAGRLRPDHPRLRLEVVAGVEHVDLTRGDADLAIRTRAPGAPELMSLASGTSAVGVFAAPRYVESLVARLDRDLASTPPALHEIDWITWARPFEHVPPRPMLERAIPDFEPAFASDDYLVLRSAVAAGLGAMVLDGSSGLEGATSGLVAIDLGFSLPPNEFHLVCAKSMQFVPRVRVVADQLVALFREARGADDRTPRSR